MPVASSTGSTTCQPPAPSTRTLSAAAAEATTGTTAGDHVLAASDRPTRPATCDSAESYRAMPSASWCFRVSAGPSLSRHAGETTPNPTPRGPQSHLRLVPTYAAAPGATSTWPHD